MGNEDWAHFTFGRKIQQAIDFNAKGRNIAIIAEEPGLMHCAEGDEGQRTP